MKIGAASTTLTLTLAAVLVLMSQNTAPTRADKPAPVQRESANRETAVAAPQVAVRLPPPPAVPVPATPPVPSASEIVKPAPQPLPRVLLTRELLTRAPLKPTAAKPEPPAAVLAPLQQTPSPVPAAKPALAPTQRKSSPRTVTPKAKSEGRALLRMLEAGEGPAIEIAWPASPAARARLYRLFTRCYGMQTVLLHGQGTLYRSMGARGTPWQVNRDAFSGFVRQPAGTMSSVERNVVAAIETHHGLRNGSPVRVFPRSVDATLLGGLRRIVGKSYAGYETIRARYDLSGDRISVVDVTADGSPLPGSVTLPAGRCG